MGAADWFRTQTNRIGLGGPATCCLLCLCADRPRIQSPEVTTGSGRAQLRPAGEDPGADVEWPFRFLLPRRDLRGANVPPARDSQRAQRRVVYETGHNNPRNEL